MADQAVAVETVLPKAPARDCRDCNICGGIREAGHLCSRRCVVCGIEIMKNRSCGKCRKRLFDARKKAKPEWQALKNEAAKNRKKFCKERRSAVSISFDSRCSGKLRDIGRDGTSIKALLLKRARTSEY